MLTVDRITLLLPPGLERRAPAIARLLARELGELGPSLARDLALLRAPPVAIPPGLSDRAIASRLAEAIAGAAGIPAPGAGRRR